MNDAYYYAVDIGDGDGLTRTAVGRTRSDVEAYGDSGIQACASAGGEAARKALPALEPITP